MDVYVSSSRIRFDDTSKHRTYCKKFFIAIASSGDEDIKRLADHVIYIPTTKELGGGVQDVFDTYILPSYEMPSAGGSGHGVTQWYAESNQTGFIGNFVAGAEGHGSVLGQ